MISLEGIISLHFYIGFISDLVLNYLSRQSYSPKSIRTLEVYFMRNTIKSELFRNIVSATNAGFTIVGALIITMLFSKMIFGFTHPIVYKQLYLFIPLAFIIGYIADIFIYKTQLFGKTLNSYYKDSGSGLWGALAFIFSILTSYFLIYFF
jgi:hypothetical protein